MVLCFYYLSNQQNEKWLSKKLKISPLILQKYESETEEDDAEGGGTNSNINADVKTEPDELVHTLKDDNSSGVDKGATTCSPNVQSTNDAGKNITISHDAAAVAATSA